MIRKSLNVGNSTIIITVGKDSWLSIVDSKNALSAKVTKKELKELRKLIKQALNDRRIQKRI